VAKSIKKRKRKRSIRSPEIKKKQKFWSEFITDSGSSLWIEGKITKIYNNNRYELLYADGDYVDQHLEELYQSPPEDVDKISFN